MKSFAVVSIALLLAIGIGVGAVASVRTTTSTAPIERCLPQKDLICVTRADGGHSVHVRLGERLEVVLSDSGLVWSGLREIGPQLLRVVGTVVRVEGGLSESYSTIRTGQTTLQATAAPKCSPNQACPQFMLLWQTRIVITS